MRTSAEGVALIKEFEGCRLTAYRCPAGVLTIGYGHTSAAGGPAVVEGMVITEVAANSLLRHDLIRIENDVQDCVTTNLTQGQFDALVSWVFNLGIGALRTSTLLKRVNAGRFDAVPAEFMKWTKARVRGELVDLPGLVRRRRAEVALWRSMPDSAPVVVDETRATPEPPAPSKSIVESKQAIGGAVAGASGVAGLADQVAQHVDTSSGFLHALKGVGTSPWTWVAIIGIAAACAVIYYRHKALKEEGG
jgi:lysozyme